MTAKVFISCGQREGERKIAQDIQLWLKEKGFLAFVAVEQQSLQDVNNGIVRQLATADYYLMVDFPREEIARQGIIHPQRKLRGSLFTHQELALAYYMGYEDSFLALRHKDMELEGLAKYLLANAKVFERDEEVLALVKDEVQKRLAQGLWSLSFSRQLVVAGVRQDDKIIQYRDHSGDYHILAWHALKWAGFYQGYECTILPHDERYFSLFHIDAKDPTLVYLASMADSYPREPIVRGCRGPYQLKYRLLGVGFPIVEFLVKLDLTGDLFTTKAKLVNQDGP